VRGRKSADSRKVQEVFCGERLHAAEIHAVWPQTQHLPSKTRAAIDALVQQVPAILADPQGAKVELELPEAPA
jgi:DNA-binding transcriptional LysR family regulator